MHTDLQIGWMTRRILLPLNLTIILLLFLGPLGQTGALSFSNDSPVRAVAAAQDETETTELPPTIEELCDDGLDNDGDGLIDEDCPIAPPSGPEPKPVQPTDEPPLVVEVCGDAIDNDSDGAVDEECPSEPISEEPQAPEELCDDGVDNNGDGQVDETCQQPTGGPTESVATAESIDDDQAAAVSAQTQENLLPDGYVGTWNYVFPANQINDSAILTLSSGQTGSVVGSFNSQGGWGKCAWSMRLGTVADSAVILETTQTLGQQLCSLERVRVTLIDGNTLGWEQYNSDTGGYYSGMGRLTRSGTTENGTGPTLPSQFLGVWSNPLANSNPSGAPVRMTLRGGSVGSIVGDVALENGCHFDFTLVGVTAEAADFSTMLSLGQCGAAPYRSTFQLLDTNTLRWQTYRPDGTLEVFYTLTKEGTLIPTATVVSPPTLTSTPPPVSNPTPGTPPTTVNPTATSTPPPVSNPTRTPRSQRTPVPTPPSEQAQIATAKQLLSGAGMQYIVDAIENGQPLGPIRRGIPIRFVSIDIAGQIKAGGPIGRVLGTMRLNNLFLSWPSQDLATILAHEGQHVADLRKYGYSRANSTTSNCYSIELRGHITEVYAWQSFYGIDGKPDPGNNPYELYLNNQLWMLHNNPTGFVDDIYARYTSECRTSKLFRGSPNDAFLTTDGLPLSVETEIPTVYQAFDRMRERLD